MNTVSYNTYWWIACGTLVMLDQVSCFQSNLIHTLIWSTTYSTYHPTCLAWGESQFVLGYSYSCHAATSSDEISLVFALVRCIATAAAAAAAAAVVVRSQMHWKTTTRVIFHHCMILCYNCSNRQPPCTTSFRMDQAGVLRYRTFPLSFRVVLFYCI